MTEQNTMADTPMEGDIIIPEVEADNTATDSPTETKDTEDTQSFEGDDEENTQDEDEEGTDEDIDEDGVDTDDEDDDEEDPDNVPFHKNPRWKEREEEWTERFNEQEERHQKDIQKLREEFSKSDNKKKDELESNEIPEWFGGTQNQWDKYRTWHKQQLEAVQNAAFEKINADKTAHQKAVDEATNFFKSEIKSIESDTSLNPDGLKVDPNKLLKTVMDNDLIDSKGQWNYKAGWKMMQKSSLTKKPVVPDNTKNKRIAGVITSKNKGETSPKNFKTTEDFQSNRPW
jgi:hypothetical protein